MPGQVTVGIPGPPARTSRQVPGRSTRACESRFTEVPPPPHPYRNKYPAISAIILLRALIILNSMLHNKREVCPRANPAPEDGRGASLVHHCRVVGYRGFR